MAINLGSTASTLGSALGTGLAQPIHERLDLLAQQKLLDLQSRQRLGIQQAEQKQYQEALEPLFGKEVSQFLSVLSPIERRSAMQNIGGLVKLGQQPAIGLDALLAGQLPRQTAAKIAEPEENIIDIPGEPQRTGLETLMPEERRVVEEPSRTKLLEDIFTSPSEKIEKEKLDLKKYQINQQERLQAFKETKKLREEINQKAQAARQNIHDLSRMEELQETGNLDTPGYVEFLNRFGLSIPALMNPESQEFQKIAYNFMRDAKSIFGARISNMEIENFLKTIPALNQSNEGRKRVIANLKYIARANLAYNDAMKEVMRENKGAPPLDLAEKIDDKIDKKLNTFSKKFKKDMAKPTPPEQNRLKAALQATLGRLPKAALGAGAGAYAGGKYLGPIGAVGGGLLGGLAGLSGMSVKDLL